MDEPVESGKPAGQWMRKNLVALGSAAAFTVYSAGYFRTREAAERFAGESVQRRGAVAMTPPPTGAAVPAAPARNVGDVPPASKRAVMPPTSVPKAATVHGVTTRAAAPAAAPAVAPAAAPAASPSVPAAQPVVQAPAQPVAPVPPADASPSPVQTVAPVDSSAKSPEKKDEKAKLKDGVFYGWGTSRHGDIQASIEIQDGRIVGAYISQCRTQYSCSWVSALPGEVVARQSPEVDYVSGATQSSNAFYYAVVEALSKAK
jgi:uncharacterized protein with FMN-binding domain